MGIRWVILVCFFWWFVLYLVTKQEGGYLFKPGKPDMEKSPLLPDMPARAMTLAPWDDHPATEGLGTPF